jgi:hypothetical protein
VLIVFNWGTRLKTEDSALDSGMLLFREGQLVAMIQRITLAFVRCLENNIRKEKNIIGWLKRNEHYFET